MLLLRILGKMLLKSMFWVIFEQLEGPIMLLELKMLILMEMLMLPMLKLLLNALIIKLPIL